MDDVNLAVIKIKPGYIFSTEDKELIFCENQFRTDQNLSPELKTFTVLQSMANSVLDMIEWEIDIPSNHKGGLLPVLYF